MSKKAFYGNFEFGIYESVYEPREDSFLIAEKLEEENLKGKDVLDMGTGCGILGIIAAGKGARVIATDINREAIKCAKSNAKKEIDLRTGNLFEKITEKFDLIVFNAPYLEDDEERKDFEQYTYQGVDFIKGFLEVYKNYLKENGKAWIVVSSLTGLDIDGKVIAEKKVAFETIYLYELGA